MIRRNTWIVLVLLAGLIGFAYYWNQHKAQQAASATPTTAPGSSSSSSLLFSAAEGAPKDIKIQDSTGKSVEFGRNEAGAWVLKAPTETQADQASAEAVASQVSALRVISSVELGLDVVGLDKPSYIVTMSTGGKSHTLNVGALTPIQDGYYTSLDGGPVRIVDKQGLDALFPLVNQPPFAMTPTPLVTPTELTTPTAMPTDTPTAAGTSTLPVTAPAATPTP
jgi:hypothetical protein